MTTESAPGAGNLEWEWDGDCTDCSATLTWEGDAPTSADEALCHDCEAARLRAELADVQAQRDAALAKLAELDADRERVTPAELLRQGGEWLGAARNWIKWHVRNGSHVDWGSSDVLEKQFTARDVDELAAEVAALAMRPQPSEARVIACLRARWDAERALAERSKKT